VIDDIEIEQLRLAHVGCDYVRRNDFLRLCERWLTQTAGSFNHIVTLNPEMVLLAEERTAFREAVNAAELRVPDGAGIVWARWFIRSRFWSLWPSLLAFPFVMVERITGVDSVEALASLCEKQGVPMYLLGGTQTQVVTTAQYLRKKYPRLTVDTSADHTFALDGPPAILTDIQEKQPGVLLVAYGAPRQTEWIERHRNDLPSVRIAMGVGGAFAILSEDRPRAPKFLQRLNLEWLWRLILEPSRLPRIWRATVRFPVLIQQQKEADPPELIEAAS